VNATGTTFYGKHGEALNGRCLSYRYFCKSRLEGQDPGGLRRAGYAQVLREIELAAGAFGVMLQYLNVLSPKDIETAFRAASKDRADGVLVTGSAVLSSHRT